MSEDSNKSAKPEGAENKKRGAGGRPTSYKPEYAKLAYNYCLLGATDPDLARFLGVSPRTIAAWKVSNEEFSQSLKAGKADADANVAKSLYKRATGYSITDTKFATHEGQITDEREYTKNFAPDVVACIFWLKNRRPDLWRDKQEVESTAKTELTISDEVQQKIVDAAKHAIDVSAPGDK